MMTLVIVSATRMVILHDIPRFNIFHMRQASEDVDLSPGNNYVAVSEIS